MSDNEELLGRDFPGPNEIPPPSQDEMTEEDLFRMRSLTISSKQGLNSETAEQSIISLADSTSNFDEHLGEDLDEEIEKQEENQSDMKLDLQQVVNGYLFGRQRNADFVPNPEIVTVLKWPKHIPVPLCPTTFDEELWNKSFEDARIYMIGTAHFSKESQEDVRKVMEAVGPDYAMVELCPARVSVIQMDEETLLKETESLSVQKMQQVIKQNGTVQGILHLLLLHMSSSVTKQLKMAPGGEFRVAYSTAVKLQNCRVVLGDRPIGISFKRALASLNVWNRLKFVCHAIFTRNEKISQEDIERCKQKDLLDELLAEMAGGFPQLSKIFVEERDLYLAHNLHSLIQRHSIEKILAYENIDRRIPFQPFTAVAVVGIGHTPGIVANWEKPIDIIPLITIPDQPISVKIFGYTMKALYWGAIGYVVYRAGSRIARRFIQ
ncbi:unnamed protein product [Caenorhabditis angaria]|uniref:TraB domain-containing protein n=1 Tax=Caenorhabditis angaria TaxID=860376 RepID=A0A9P1N307_9PELO|nr:unnamed protein product [Caenorhabditis angaria]